MLDFCIIWCLVLVVEAALWLRMLNVLSWPTAANIEEPWQPSTGFPGIFINRTVEAFAIVFMENFKTDLSIALLGVKNVKFSIE